MLYFEKKRKTVTAEEHFLRSIIEMCVCVCVREMCVCVRVGEMCVCVCVREMCVYGVATISRLLKMIGLFCKRAL